MHDTHFGPALSDAFGHARRRIPERETVPDANEKLCFGGTGTRHGWFRRKKKLRIVAAISNPSKIKAARSDQKAQVAAKSNASQSAFMGRAKPMISDFLSSRPGSTSISSKSPFRGGARSLNLFGGHAQIAPGHFTRFGDAENAEHCGCNIAQRTTRG